MDNLWKPTKQDRSSLNLGTRKLRISRLKSDGLLENGVCPYCNERVFKYTDKDEFLTLGGSKHQCKDMPKGEHVVIY